MSSDLLARIQREQRVKRAAARRQYGESGLPWRDPTSVNGWIFLCPACGAEVRCGWDDGYGLPERVDVWDGTTTLEGACDHCQTTSAVVITWTLDFDASAPTVVAVQP